MLSHGLHYASCVFEGERVYGGKIFKLREHSQRLIESGRILGFEIPYSLAEIEAASNEVVRAEHIKDGYVRPIAWRGAEQMGVAAQIDQDPPRHRGVGMAGLFLARCEDEGHPHVLGQVGAAGAAHRADRGQGGRALHDLHALQARRRGGRL